MLRLAQTHCLPFEEKRKHCLEQLNQLQALLTEICEIEHELEEERADHQKLGKANDELFRRRRGGGSQVVA